MHIRSILVATDLSPHDAVGVQRACQLAATHRAALKLVYVPRGQDPEAEDPATLPITARLLQRRLGLPVRALLPGPASLADLRHQDAADLLVLVHRHEPSPAGWWRGQPLQQLLRHWPSPVLVARSVPQPHYRRILATIDLSAPSRALVAAAAAMDPQAELELFHAVSTREQARRYELQVPPQAASAYREECARFLRYRMVSMTDSFGTRRNRVLATIGQGEIGRQTVIQQEHSGADLVVVGSRRQSLVREFLRGSIAWRVVAEAASDVLVVPMDLAPTPSKLRAGFTGAAG